ncbi:MAG TPA: hypothetical protein VIP70_04625 [Nitrososphaeraceae archaeon]
MAYVYKSYRPYATLPDSRSCYEIATGKDEISKLAYSQKNKTCLKYQGGIFVTLVNLHKKRIHKYIIYFSA